jgi:hypothetical protein
VQPSISNGTISWDVEGQHVLSQELSPASGQTKFTLLNESQLLRRDCYAYFNYGFVLPQERKWQVRETPTDTNTWHFFLHALSAYDAAQAPAISRVDGTGVSGALISPSGETATLAVFSNNPSSRLVQSGYTLTVTTVSSQTQGYLLDLDASRAWSIQIDSNPPVAARFGPGGVAQAPITGAGQHTLRVQPL